MSARTGKGALTKTTPAKLRGKKRKNAGNQRIRLPKGVL